MKVKRWFSGLRKKIKKNLPQFTKIRNPDSFALLAGALALMFCIIIVVLLNVLNNIENKIKAASTQTPTVTLVRNNELSTMVMHTFEAIYSKDLLTPSVTLTPTQTMTFTPSGADYTATALKWTSTSTPTIDTSFLLLTPKDKDTLAGSGFIRFSWNVCPGAAGYDLMIKPPDSHEFTLFTIVPMYDRYLESLPSGGEYHWWVNAKDRTGKVITIAGPFMFTKPVSKLRMTDTPIPNQ
jgi:hypothetical protein